MRLYIHSPRTCTTGTREPRGPQRYWQASANLPHDIYFCKVCARPSLCGMRSFYGFIKQCRRGCQQDGNREGKRCYFRQVCLNRCGNLRECPPYTVPGSPVSPHLQVNLSRAKPQACARPASCPWLSYKEFAWVESQGLQKQRLCDRSARCCAAGGAFVSAPNEIDGTSIDNTIVPAPV